MRCRDSEAEKHFLFQTLLLLPYFLYVFSEMVWVSALMTASASVATSVKTSKIYTSNISLKRERNRSEDEVRLQKHPMFWSTEGGAVRVSTPSLFLTLFFSFAFYVTESRMKVRTWQLVPPGHVDIFQLPNRFSSLITLCSPRAVCFIVSVVSATCQKNARGQMWIMRESATKTFKCLDFLLTHKRGCFRVNSFCVVSSSVARNFFVVVASRSVPTDHKGKPPLPTNFLLKGVTLLSLL